MRNTISAITALATFAVGASIDAQVLSSGVDSTAGANWRTAAAFETDNEYGTLGYVVFGLHVADAVYTQPYDVSSANALNEYSLPAGVTVSTADGNIGMWSGNGNFGTMEDPTNANAITSAPVLANSAGPKQFTISRAESAAFRVTIMTASGDDQSTTFTVTVDDGSGSQQSAYGHSANGLAYHVFEVADGTSDIVVDVASAAENRSLMGIAFDTYVPPVSFPVNTWQTDGGGNWSATANWDPAVPNGAKNRALFDDTLPITGPLTATLDADVGLGELVLDSAHTITIDGPSSLTFNNMGATSTLTASAGSHVIAADVTLGGGLDVSPATGNSIEISGALAGTAPVNQLGDGTLVLTGDLSGFSGAGSVEGMLVIDHDVDYVFSSGFSGDGMVRKEGTGTLIFGTRVSMSYTGGTTVAAGVLELAANDVFGNHVTSQTDLTIESGAMVTNGPEGAADASGFNAMRNLTLNGGELRITDTVNDSFPSYALKQTVTVGGGSPSLIGDPGMLAGAAINIGDTVADTLTTFDVADATGDPAVDLTVSAVLQDNRAGDGALLSNGLRKTGAGTMQLTRLNFYSNTTSVEAGTLVLDQDFLADESRVELMTGATLQLDFAATDSIGKLFIDGAEQAVGTWGATGSGADNTSALITGTGLLDVTGLGGNPYNDWAAGFPTLTDPDFIFDFENDGLETGLEYVLGGDPTAVDAAAIAPTSSMDANDFVFVYRRSDLANEDPDTFIDVEYSTDLLTWTFAISGVDGVATTEADDAAEAGVDLVTVRIPRSLAGPGGMLFARLNVELFAP